MLHKSHCHSHLILNPESACYDDFGGFGGGFAPSSVIGVGRSRIRRLWLWLWLWVGVGLWLATVGGNKTKGLGQKNECANTTHHLPRMEIKTNWPPPC